MSGPIALAFRIALEFCSFPSIRDLNQNALKMLQVKWLTCLGSSVHTQMRCRESCRNLCIRRPQLHHLGRGSEAEARHRAGLLKE